MGFLEKVTKGKQPGPIVALVYGKDGLGKSTFAASSPAPIFVGPEVESGTKHLDVARAPHPASYAEVLAQLAELASSPHDYRTLVFESLDWLEPMIWKHVGDQQKPKWENIESPGYGKGYVIAADEWRNFAAHLEKISGRGMNVLLLAHYMVRPFNDPASAAAYDRYQVKLHDRAAAIMREFVDDVLFVTTEVFTEADPKKKGKVWAFGEGVRIIQTEGRPGFDAKNRHGLPFVLPLSWEAYFTAVVSGQPQDPEVMIRNIQAMIEQLSDEAVKKAAVEWLEKTPKDNAAKLAVIENRLRVKLNQL